MSAIDQDFVRDLIERHSDASGGNGRDFHNGAYMAIADELNATLGSSNCTNDCTNSERNGTLTAERVMAIAGKHQPDYCSDTHVCFDWQAIADELNATLGDVPRLPYFWTHDGVLHIELPKLPDSISVLLPDERDREVHSARVWQYTRGDADLAAENAKLRELAAGIGHLLFPLDVDYCAICPRDDINHPCPVHTANGGECLYKTDMRELRVEVDV